MIDLQHGRIRLALHPLTAGEGPNLLLLHALYGSSRDWGELAQHWPGPVYGVDFSGHGESERVHGGAYYAELLLGDADAALAHIGPAAVAGAGIGAYVALLLAGARPDQVPAALLLPGAGLAGGGDWPDFSKPFAVPIAAANAEGSGEHDPFLRVLESDVRPTEYVARFAVAARKLLLAKIAEEVPDWWAATLRADAVEQVEPTPAVALGRLIAALSE
jgi:pimeloyl-ACP methyl ester carboxylesterase